MTVLGLLADTSTTEKPASGGVWFFLALVVVIFVGLVVFGATKARRLGKRDQAEALRRGWSFVAEDPSLKDHFRTWPFTVEPQQSRYRNIMTASIAGHGVTVFDYQVHFGNRGGIRVDGIPFSSGTAPADGPPSIFDGVDLVFGINSGPNQRFRRTSRSDPGLIHGVCVMEMPGALPQTLVKLHVPGGQAAVDLLAGTSESPDLDVGDPLFDKRFEVKAVDPAVARALIGPQARQALLHAMRPLSSNVCDLWTWDRYLFTMSVRPITFSWLDEHLDMMAAIIDAAPPTLWDRTRS